MQHWQKMACLSGLLLTATLGKSQCYQLSLFDAYFGPKSTSLSDEFNYKDNDVDDIKNAGKWYTTNCLQSRHATDGVDGYYHDANVYCVNGTLILTAKPERGWGKQGNNTFVGSASDWWKLTDPGSTNWREYYYTGGRVTSTQPMHYGKYELKGKIAAGNSMWSSFWMRSCGSTIGDTEIDVFEFTKGNVTQPQSNFHNETISPVTSCHYVLPSTHDFSAQDHVFTLIWLPDQMHWFIDGCLKRTVYGWEPGFPHLPSSLNISLGIEEANLEEGEEATPDQMTVDYFHYYPMVPDYDPNSFTKEWSSKNKNGAYFGFKLAEEVLAGDFDGDGNAELLKVRQSQATDLVVLYDYSDKLPNGKSKKNWQEIANNNYSGKIANWITNPGDQYCVGDFTGSGADQMLCISTGTQWAQMVKYDGTSDWIQLWSNGGNNGLTVWTMGAQDQFIAGDFDGDQVDEILALRHSNGEAQLLEYNGTKWVGQWHNNISGALGNWNLSSVDLYTKGDFDSDGTEELFCVQPNSGWSKILEFDGISWNSEWSNGGSGMISGWSITSGDQFYAANLNGNGADELLCIGTTTSQVSIMRKVGNAVNQLWTNGGSHLLANWEVDAQYKLVVGNFDDLQPNLDLIFTKTSAIYQCAGKPEHLLSGPSIPVGRHHVANLSEESETAPSQARIFPNPCKDQFQVMLPEAAQAGPVGYELLNLQGQLVAQGTIQPKGAEGKLYLQQELNGVFFLRLNGAEGYSETLRLVIQQ